MSEPTNTTNQWSEDDSTTFLDLAEIFVPGRAEQTATFLQLIPAHSDEHFTIVELASGEGVLAQAILEKFPQCHYIALDGSATMREQLAQKLEQYSNRIDIRPFNLAEQAWRSALPAPLRCVLSSLCVHHLPDERKQQLFHDMATQLAPGGTLLLADVIEPATQQIANLFARQYDDIVRQQSLAIRGDLSGHEQFLQQKWNYFLYDYNNPESYDHPSRLSDQLVWLKEAGFSIVDCFWMQAGHAIYGGYR
ncbi:MAG: class I SAM-dependent methyltransferase [Ktedonobacteraceae bacterium]